jgi:hypothetical protein
MHLLCSFSMRAIKANAADLGEVAGVLADTLGEALKAISRVPPGGDPMVLLPRIRAALDAAYPT